MQDTEISSLLNHAIAEHKSGNYSDAENLYRQVLELSPNNIKVLQCLAVLSLTLEQPKVAINLLKKAISVKGDNPDIFYNLGLAYQRSNDIDSAIYYYQLTIALNPEYSLAYNNIGVAYQHLGKIELANLNLVKAFTFSPECIDAYFNFSQSHKFTENDKTIINNIEQLLELKLWNDNQKIKLNFTLGKIYDDLNMFETAFKYYEEGNSLKDRGFNIDIFSTYIDKIISNFNIELLQSLIKPGLKSSKKFVFIIGMPRSGSTLTEQIIASHPAVQSAGETGFIGGIVDDFPALMHTDKTYPECIKYASQSNLTRISAGLQRQIDSLPHSKKFITEKSPINFLHIGLILILFPNSIIIHSKRNSIDTCLSCFFQNFNRQHQYSYNLKNQALFHNEYSRLMTYWKSTFGDRIYEINYEKLVNNQEIESKRLIKACNLNWDERCLNFHKSNIVVNTASKWQVRREIYTSSIKKWKNYEKYIGELFSNLNNVS